MHRGSVKRLALWVHGAIAGLLATVTAAMWGRADTLSRAELLIPAAFWTAAFIFIALQRRSARS